MKPQSIVQQDPGELCIRLSESFSPHDMHRCETIAQIVRTGAKIVLCDNQKKTKTIALSNEELDRLTEAWQEIKAYWNETPLPYRHVLLQCGCIINWDDEEEHRYPHPDDYRASAVWCPSHEESAVYRYNQEDFRMDLPYQLVLLDCGCIAQWTQLQTTAHLYNTRDDLGPEAAVPFVRCWVDCSSHGAQQIKRLNETDFVEVKPMLYLFSLSWIGILRCMLLIAFYRFLMRGRITVYRLLLLMTILRCTLSITSYKLHFKLRRIVYRFKRAIF